MRMDISSLLDAPPYPAERYGRLADRLALLLGTTNDVLLIQAEAVLALEAVATSIAREGIRALNIVTSPYGTWFGDWLTRGAADVDNVCATPAKPITLEAVRGALDKADYDVLSIVHAESATGILNPLPEIAALAREKGVLTIVDAVASIGGHPVDVGRLGIDIAVVGPQKALAGPAGVSAISVSQRAWKILDHDRAPTNSMLSLLDQKKLWLDCGRAALPGTPAPLEFFALEAALDRIEAEGLPAVHRRHAQATLATRAALEALATSAWVDVPDNSVLVTTAILPDGIDRDTFLIAANSTPGADITAGVGPGAERLFRLNHTGRRASEEAVRSNIAAVSAALRQVGLPSDDEAGQLAIASVYGA